MKNPTSKTEVLTLRNKAYCFRSCSQWCKPLWLWNSFWAWRTVPWILRIISVSVSVWCPKVSRPRSLSNKPYWLRPPFSFRRTDVLRSNISYESANLGCYTCKETGFPSGVKGNWNCSYSNLYLVFSIVCPWLLSFHIVLCAAASESRDWKIWEVYDQL